MNKNMIVVGGVKKLLLIANENLPLILSGAGVVGCFVSVYLGYQAGKKAPALIERRKEEIAAADGIDVEEVTLTRWQTVQATASVVWKPAVAVGMTTLCIVASQYITAERLAALGAAYAMSEKKVKEITKAACEELSPDKADKTMAKADSAIIGDNVNVKFESMNGVGPVFAWDAWRGVPFWTSMDTINAIPGYVNGCFAMDDDVVTMDEIYEKLGLPCGNLLGKKYGFSRSEGPFEIGSDQGMRLSYIEKTVNGELKPVLVVSFQPDCLF